MLMMCCCGREACASIKRVPDNGTPSQGWYRRPNIELVLNAVIVEFGEGNPRFDDSVSVFSAYFDDFVHAMKIEGYRASHARSWSTISVQLLDDRLRCVKESTNPRFLPLENVHTGMTNSFEIFSTSLSSSTFLGRTAALGILRVPSASCNSYGSMYSVKASPSYTCASPTILLYLLIAVSNASLSIPGGSTDFSGTVTESLNRL